MKSIKHIALSIIVTLSVFGAVLYTSCTKDACKGITCLNGGVCSSGACVACPTGIGGNNCEVIYRNLYNTNVYTGFATYYNKTILVDTVLVDSTYVIATDTGNTLTFNASADTTYSKMNMTWNRPGKSSATTTIFLTKNASSGSGFTVSSFTVDSFNCTGTGSINAGSASVNLVATPPHSPAIVITLNNFSRK